MDFTNIINLLIENIKKQVDDETSILEIEYFRNKNCLTVNFQIYFTIDAYEKIIVGEIENHYYDNRVKDVILWDSGNSVYVEVKPSFDQNNMERLFVNNQKFIYDKCKLFVNLVEPIELFKKTFLPLAAEPYFRYKVVPKKAAAKGKKKGDYKFDWKPRNITEFLNINK